MASLLRSAALRAASAAAPIRPAAAAVARPAAFAVAPARAMATQRVAPSVFGATGKLATKLFEAGKKSKNLPTVRAELRKFKELYESSSDLRSLFLNPVLSTEQKNASLTALFKKEGIKTAEAQSFLKGAAATKNLGRIKQIVADFDKLVTFELKEVHATVTSAEPLQAAQLQRLEGALKKRIAPEEKLLLQTKVEPALLGGVIVMLGQQMLDLSVSAQIRRIDQALRQ